MKKILLVALCALYALASYSQSNNTSKSKPTVFIDYFKPMGRMPFAWVEGLRTSIIEGIHKMDRVILIDVDSQEALFVEAQSRSAEEYAEDEADGMERFNSMNRLGAQYIVTGQVASMTSTLKKDSDGKGHYDAAVNYTLKVINAGNGALLGTKNVQLTGKGGKKDEAIANAFTYTLISTRDFVDDYFKIEGTILEVNSKKKGKAEEVYIDLGSMVGVQEAQKFTVYAEREIAGRIARKEIGRLTVKTVEGEEISLCKVQKGGEDIMQAIDNGQNIIIISREQTLMGGIFH